MWYKFWLPQREGIYNLYIILNPMQLKRMVLEFLQLNHKNQFLIVTSVEWALSIGSSNSIQVSTKHSHGYSESPRSHWSNFTPFVFLGVVALHVVQALNSVLASHCIQKSL